MGRFFNPVFKKELKQTARMKRTALLILFYNFALALFGLFAFYITFHAKGTYHTYINYADILNIYMIITGIEFILILFLVPALTAGSIVGEREKKTLDILLTTKMTPGQIVTGKLMASLSTMVLLAFSSLPVISIVFSVGGITLWDLVKFMIFLMVTAVYIGSIGILFSTLCKRTTTATVSTYAVMLLLVVGIAALLFGIVLIYNIRTWGFADYNNIIWINSGIGKLVFLLFLNPFISYTSMLRDQIGYMGGLMNGIIVSGNLGSFTSNYWFAISMGIQLLLSAVCLKAASIILSPLKRYQEG